MNLKLYNNQNIDSMQTLLKDRNAQSRQEEEKNFKSLCKCLKGCSCHQSQISEEWMDLFRSYSCPQDHLLTASNLRQLLAVVANVWSPLCNPLYIPLYQGGTWAILGKLEINPTLSEGSGCLRGAHFVQDCPVGGMESHWTQQCVMHRYWRKEGRECELRCTSLFIIALHPYDPISSLINQEGFCASVVDAITRCWPQRTLLTDFQRGSSNTSKIVWLLGHQ